MRITFVTRKFGNVERNSHCDVLHITPVRVARLVLDCNDVFAIKAYRPLSRRLDRCDRVIQNESRDPNGGNMCLFSAATCTSQFKLRFVFSGDVYVTMQSTFLTRKQNLFDLYLR